MRRFFRQLAGCSRQPAVWLSVISYLLFGRFAAVIQLDDFYGFYDFYDFCVVNDLNGLNGFNNFNGEERR